MNRKITLFLASFILLFCSVFAVNAQENTEEEKEKVKPKIFIFKGQVHENREGETLKGALIEVFDGGDLVHELYTKGGGKFDFEVESEKQYMMDVSYEGLRTKSIWINTKRTQDVKNKVPPFAFDVVLKKEKITRYDEMSEIPVTLIKYDKRRDAFYMDKTYSDALKSKKKKIENNSIKVR